MRSNISDIATVVESELSLHLQLAVVPTDPIVSILLVSQPTTYKNVLRF